MRIFEQAAFNRPTIAKHRSEVTTEDATENQANKVTTKKTDVTQDRFETQAEQAKQRSRAFVNGEKHDAIQTENNGNSGVSKDASQPRNVKSRGRLRKAFRKMFRKKPSPRPQPKPTPRPVTTDTVTPPNTTDSTVTPPPAPQPAPAPVTPLSNTANTDAPNNTPPQGDVVWKGMTADEQKFFDRSFEAKNFKDKQVGAWRQTTEGNCVSVAAIKGAMDKYDNQVFDKMAKTPNGIEVTMKDGVKVKVSPSELKMAKSYSDFKGNDQDALSYATVCYAAMAKRAQNDGRVITSRSGMFGRRTSTIGGYKGALMQLNNGEVPTNGAKYLGLKHKLERIDLSEVKGKDVLASNSAHAFFIDNVEGETLLDKYGKPGTLDSASGRFAINKAYILKD